MAKKGVTEAYLDSVFSVYIRMRDADHDGYVTCCNCGKKLKWTEATCGHYVKRRHRSLRWDDRNCHAECQQCNTADVNLGYADFMVRKYGPDIWQQLEAQKNINGKRMPFERKIMVANYKQKIKQFKQIKGL